MEIVDQIVSIEEEEDAYLPRCPSCRGIIRSIDINNDIDIIEGTSLFPTLICIHCGNHIVLSRDLIERIRGKDDKKTVHSTQ